MSYLISATKAPPGGDAISISSMCTDTGSTGTVHEEVVASLFWVSVHLFVVVIILVLGFCIYLVFC